MQDVKDKHNQSLHHPTLPFPPFHHMRTYPCHPLLLLLLSSNPANTCSSAHDDAVADGQDGFEGGELVEEGVELVFDGDVFEGVAAFVWDGGCEGGGEARKEGGRVSKVDMCT